MNTDIVAECTRKSLAGQITFPEVVMKLSGAGVERYTVDLVGHEKHSYGAEGEFYSTAIDLPDMPSIPENFDGASVKAVLAEIQQQKIDYVTFLRKIMRAGCCEYQVYIGGRQALYLGRNGGQHIEMFPVQSDAKLTKN